jgi:TetR/AcrR family transcriptional regulator
VKQDNLHKFNKDAATQNPPRPASDAVARILAAAETLFSEHGFEAVSMNSIAERAGVSKANIFHHFSSKQALYVAVVRAACQDSIERLQHLGSEAGPFPERLAQFVRNQLGDMLEREQIHRLIKRELLRDGERQGRELAEQVWGDGFGRFVGILRAAQTRGELRADVDPAMVATMLIAANAFFFDGRDVMRHLPGITFAADPDAYTRMATEIILRGILNPSDNKKTPDR